MYYDAGKDPTSLQRFNLVATVLGLHGRRGEGGDITTMILRDQHPELLKLADEAGFGSILFLALWKEVDDILEDPAEAVAELDEQLARIGAGSQRIILQKLLAELPVRAQAE